MCSSSSSSNITIRERQEGDLPVVATVLEDVYSTDGYPVEGVNEAQAWLSPPGLLLTWVAELNGEIVGQASILRATEDNPVAHRWLQHNEESVADIAIFVRLFVRKAARGHGLGKLMSLAAMRWAKDNSKRLLLNVIDKDTTAIKMYEKLGWRQFGVGQYITPAGAIWSESFYVYPEQET